MQLFLDAAINYGYLVALLTVVTIGFLLLVGFLEKTLVKLDDFELLSRYLGRVAIQIVTRNLFQIAIIASLLFIVVLAGTEIDHIFRPPDTRHHQTIEFGE